MKTTLLALPEIQNELENLFALVPDNVKEDCHDLRLKNSSLNHQDISRLCIAFEVKLPESFENIILRYDLGDLTLGKIWFGSNDSYIEYILRENTESKHFSWWGNGSRPIHYLLVANSDGYLILLNTKTEEIFAFLRSESYSKANLIASKFDLFLRAAATIYIHIRNLNNRNIGMEGLMTSITTSLECSNDSDFWKEIIN